MKRQPNPQAQPGIAARWSEHVRGLERHLQATVPSDKRRRRYDILKFQQSSSSLNVLILDQCDLTSIAAREALAITFIQSRANGSELKHLSETFRKTEEETPEM